MNYLNILSKLLVSAALVFLMVAPAYAVKVQVFQPAEEEKTVAEIRDEAVDLAFAQAIMSEALRMIPGELDPGRSEVLKKWLGDRKDTFVSGYRDKSVSQEENGVSVGINVDVNRKALRGYLKKIGVFSTYSKKVEASLQTSITDQQTDDLDELNRLMIVFGVQKVAEGADIAVSINKAGKKSWSGSLSVSGGQSWKSYGLDLDKVWSKLWENYFSSIQSSADMNPRATLEITGWFSPEGVREFGRVLRGWDAAVQEVELGGLEMKPTAVSAFWTMEIADKWLLKSYLSDYLPQRGLSYTINGINEN
jgi:hypothetical protein